jgi:hypothetical protein
MLYLEKSGHGLNKVLQEHLPGETEENHKKPQLG